MPNFLLKLQDVFNLLPNLNVAELIKSFAGMLQTEDSPLA